MTQESPRLWPRLLTLKLAAAYLSVSVSTVRDYIDDGILQPVPLPGSLLRKNGKIVARPSARAIGKILITRESLDHLIDAAGLVEGGASCHISEA